MTDLVAELYEKHLSQFAQGRLVDLGCGKAPLYEAYRGKVTDSVCADWANSLHSNPLLDVVCDLSSRLPFEKDEFNTAILSDVLEHLPTPELFWAELARVLKPGGKLLMNVPFLYWIHEEPYDYYRYTEFALRRFADQNGFKVLILEPVGGAGEVLADFLSKLLARVPLLGHFAAVAMQSAALRLRRTGIGRKISTRTAVRMPLGYFLVAERI